MRILMFAPAFAPHMGSESLVTSKLVLLFQQAGWEVDVVSRREPALYGSNWDPPWSGLECCTNEVVPPELSRLGMLRARLLNTVTMQHPLRGLTWAAMALAVGRRMVDSRRYDLIMSRSPPEIGHLPALILARQLDLPWIANWNDPPIGAWPAPYEKENLGVVMQFVYRRYIRRICAEATFTTFPSEELAGHFSRHFGAINQTEYSVMPHATLALDAHESPTGSKFVLRHAGKLCAARAPWTFFSGLRAFVSLERPAVGSFLLEQVGYADTSFFEISRAFEVESYVSATGPLPYLQTMDLLAQSTVNLLVEAPCNEGIFLPGKFIDYAQVRRPILAISPDRGVAARLLALNGGGIHADVRSPSAIAAAITELYQNWSAGQLDARYGSETLAQPYQPEAVIGGYRSLFQRLHCAHVA